MNDIEKFLAAVAYQSGIPVEYFYWNWASYDGAKDMREQIDYALHNVVTNHLAQAAIATEMQIVLQRQWEKALRDPITYRELYNYLTGVQNDQL